MQIKTDQFAEAARAALKDTYTRIFLDGMHQKVKERLNSMETFPDPEAARELSAAIRAEAMAKLPELLEEFEKKATALRAKVIWASDAAGANQFIVGLARENAPSHFTFITGPSMAADIQATPFKGMHGPRKYDYSVRMEYPFNRMHCLTLSNSLTGGIPMINP